MSNTKSFVLILFVELFLMILGLIKVSVTTSSFSADIPNFTLEYMFGYSLPIMAMGMIVFFCARYIFRERKTVSR